MSTIVNTTVRQLAPGFHINNLTISVDRIFIREKVASVGDPAKVMKHHTSVDMICWDEEGTIVICSLVTNKAIKVLGRIIKTKRTYIVSKYLVDLSGLGIHNNFHLKFDEHTCLDLVMGPFVDRVLNLCCPSEIPYGPRNIGTVFDVCGFVHHVSQVSIQLHEGYPVHEFFIVLESRMKDRERYSNETAFIYMRGSWAKKESKKLRRQVNKNKYKPFVLVKYLKLQDCSPSGTPVLCSMFDATKVVFHPQIQEVVEKRAELIMEH